MFREVLQVDYASLRQPARHYTYRGLKIFTSLVLRFHDFQRWKLIDQDAKYDNGNEDNKVGISQSDMYQMFAYGHKYLNGQGKLLLIYPKWTNFTNEKNFVLNDGLVLNVFPFDLDNADNSANDLLEKLKPT